MDVRLVIIDGQNDFCDPNGSLFVQGADKDMERLAKMISKLGNKINRIHATLDCHHFVDIAHPVFLVNQQGEHPNPFTLVSHDDIQKGVWRAFRPHYQPWLKHYTKQLEENGRYMLCVWPPHCLISTPGNNTCPTLLQAYQEWESAFRMVEFVSKGSNFLTEHYSAVQADVPITGGTFGKVELENDPTTMLNVQFIQSVEQGDVIFLSGEALDYCMANTVRDMAANFGTDSIKKLVLLEDCTSCVNAPGAEHLGEDFVNEMVGKGMKITTSDKAHTMLF